MDRSEQIKLIIGNLKSAAFILGEDGEDNLDSVSWRLADAGLMLREFIEEGNGEVIGVHFPTGRGAILPVKQK